MEDNFVDAPFRKHLRLRQYDYSQAGCYFITICAQHRRKILGRIVGGDDHIAPFSRSAKAEILRLSGYGECVDRYINSFEAHYKNVSVDKYVIMPNHVHLIIKVAEEYGAPRSSRPTDALIPKIIAALKTMVNREVGRPIWQSSYYDHIIRDEADYLTKWDYIDANPARWAEDEYYIAENSR